MRTKPRRPLALFRNVQPAVHPSPENLDSSNAISCLRKFVPRSTSGVYHKVLYRSLALFLMWKV